MTDTVFVPSGGCCASPATPALAESSTFSVTRRAVDPSNLGSDRVEAAIPAGCFLMGDTFGEGYHADGETPVHVVQLQAFSMDVTPVTVADFSAFVDSTGYRTDAERAGTSAVFHLLVEAEKKGVIPSESTRWWSIVRGADWRNPNGPLSKSGASPDHPVVHVSHDDAKAYCVWANRCLPTEAQWEFAARGGHTGRRFPWGDILEQDGRHHANIWQGQFPQHNSALDGFVGTAPVFSYTPNSFGLYQMIGNVWEWCADWFSPTAYETSKIEEPTGPQTGVARVVRGGSYLCHQSYCNRCRSSARSSNTPNTTTGNLGFRTVAHPPAVAAERPKEQGNRIHP